MFIAMNRFRVAEGSEGAFEQVWLSRDSHLDKVPGFVEFHLLKGLVAEDHAAICFSHGLGKPGSVRGMDQIRGVPGQRIVAQEITSPCIWIIRSSKGSRCAKRWGAAKRGDARYILLIAEVREPADVRFQGQSRKHLLAASISPFDPFRTWAWPDIGPQSCYIAIQFPRPGGAS